MTTTLPAINALRANPDWEQLPLFDRKGWTWVRFGDVVDNVNETEQDPVDAGIKRGSETASTIGCNESSGNIIENQLIAVST